MSRSLTSDRAAHYEQARAIETREQTRADWRAVLARRDDVRRTQRRAAPRNQAGAVAIIMIGALASVLVTLSHWFA